MICTGALAIAGGVSMCLRWKNIEPGVFIEKLVLLCGPVDERVAKSLMKLKKWISLPAKKACKVIAKEGVDHHDGSIGICGFVTSSVLWSLYSFLRTPSDFVATITTAISAGGDTGACDEPK
jgi:ADP-ribosylglycohydrolase